MGKTKIVSVTYNSEAPWDSLVWISQIITSLLIRELGLTPKEAGGLVKCSHELFAPIYSEESKRSELDASKDQ